MGSDGAKSWNEHESQEYPHDAGCGVCRALKRCNVCGISFPFCTNGRCGECHGRVCTSGGDTSPGHGYGNRKDALSAAMSKRHRES